MSFSVEEYRHQAKRLGRSPELIAATIGYAEKLIGKGLPVIFSAKHLCAILEILPLDFEYLLDNRQDLYRFYQIRKRRGGNRQIVVPYAKIRKMQHFIQQEILMHVPVDTHAFGYVRGRSIRQNAEQHVGADAIMNIDIAKFFDCITEKRVFGIFRSLGYAANLAVDLARIVTVPLPEEYLEAFGGDLYWYHGLVKEGSAVLPQGAPTSPILSNLVLRLLDRRLSGYCEANQLRYSRYADDMTISGAFEKLPKLAFLEKIIGEEGFRINYAKVSTYKKGVRQMVTGLTVSNGVHIHRSFKKEVKKHLYCCKKFGVEAHLTALGMKEKHLYKEWLLGKIYYIRSIEKQASEKYLEWFAQIDWPS